MKAKIKYILFFCILNTFIFWFLIFSSLYPMQSEISKLDYSRIVYYHNLTRVCPGHIIAKLSNYMKNESLQECIKVSEIIFLMQKNKRVFSLEKVIGFIEDIAYSNINNINIIHDKFNNPINIASKSFLEENTSSTKAYPPGNSLSAKGNSL